MTLICWLIGHKTTYFEYGFFTRGTMDVADPRQVHTHCLRCMKKWE